jgi:dihydroorotate dehydrogenase
MRGWRRVAYRAVRPLLFALDPERVHHIALAALASDAGRALAPFASGVGSDAGEAVEIAGLRFRNRVGLAAGFDKDGVAIRGWAALGFGFVELGTVTPRPQPGNPPPRLFRLPADEALINRMGFNNAGADALARRIDAARPHLPEGFVVGVNIGRNRDGDADDYPAAARAVAGLADYLAINVSSPNTPGLRQLQDPEQLFAIIDAVLEAAPDTPVFVKLSPDLSDVELAAIVTGLAGSEIAGLVVANTTVTRPVRSRGLAQEAGGLSGRPLASGTVRLVGEVAGKGLAIIASGGVSSGSGAAALLDAGADLVQLWTGMIFAGPGLIGEAVRETSHRTSPPIGP